MLHPLCTKFRGRFDYIRFLSNSYQLGFLSSICKNGYSTGSAFGNLIIDSMSDKICCWRFRIMRAEANMAFGITDLWDNVDEDCFSKKDSNNYCAVHCQWARSRGEWKKYPFESRKGSIVEMMLNLKRRELSFYVNGQKSGVAFHDIKIGKDIYYKMAICFRSRRSSVKLLEYTESDQEEAMKKVNQKVVDVPNDMRV